ncbi:MAG: hypothetical protein ACFBSF_09950 [Leptolyngbyaceae cyanobacterium]
MSGSSDLQESFNRFEKGHTFGSAQVAIAPEQVDLSQVYTLIDGILPFEACLYYQILPLSIEGSRLIIGTVNPDDRAASDYVKKQLSYINYSLTFRTIQSDWHRDLLSKYLSHNAKMRQRSHPQVTRPAEPATAQSPAKAAQASPSSLDSSSQATFIVDQPDEISDYVRSPSVRGVSTNSAEPELSEALETTLPTAPEPPPSSEEIMVEESPEEEAPTLVSVPRASLLFELAEDSESLAAPEDAPTVIADRSVLAADEEEVPTQPVISVSSATASAASASEAASASATASAASASEAEPAPVPDTAAANELPTTASAASAPEVAPAPTASMAEPAGGLPSSGVAATAAEPVSDKTDAKTAASEPPANAPLHLQIDQTYRHLGDVDLSTLSPKALMQTLLGQVLGEGIGRLYFERPKHTGRILWSKDGILQAVLESIDPQLFQGVINEFKLLTHLSLIAVKKPKQVEIERMYEGERILLRLRVMPNAHGEEATLQVLRGTALRFYQQQQIDKLGRDALDAAQTLSRRLDEIRDRARQTLNFKPTRSETFPAIVQLLKQMEAQIHELVAEHEHVNKTAARQTQNRR